MQDNNMQDIPNLTCKSTIIVITNLLNIRGLLVYSLAFNHGDSNEKYETV